MTVTCISSLCACVSQAWYRRACSHEALQNYVLACEDADMAASLSRYYKLHEPLLDFLRQHIPMVTHFQVWSVSPGNCQSITQQLLQQTRRNQAAAHCGGMSALLSSKSEAGCLVAVGHNTTIARDWVSDCEPNSILSCHLQPTLTTLLYPRLSSWESLSVCLRTGHHSVPVQSLHQPC